MARKFGKKNVIKLDPLAYNHGLMGESGIGKTTLAKEYCEKIAGEDGYLHLNMGKEDGSDSIVDLITEDVKCWDDMVEIKEDIIENRQTDYKDLKVIIYDTLDELIPIAEKEVVRMHNKEQRKLPPEKQKMATSVNGAFGGYGKGQDKVMEIIQDYIWDLKSVGIYMFIILHTKKRTINDPVSDTSFDILSSKTQQNYFNAIKTKLHFLGVAHVNRTIDQIENGKDFKGEKKYKGVVKGEKRVIAFRDDNYSLDSKSRFADIIDKIPLNVDAYADAIMDAILAERNKSKNGMSVEEETKKQQKEEEVKISKEMKKKEEAKKEEELKKDLIKQIKAGLGRCEKSSQREFVKYLQSEGLGLKTLVEASSDKLKELVDKVEELSSND